MILSIIIPIYNAEKYLSKCLEEVLSCPIAEMECILINDGSIDSSLTICESFARRDSRIRIIDKVNEGVSVARNTGVLAATGEYVMFLDADDYIERKKWNHFISAMSEGADFVAFSYYTLCQNGDIKEEMFKVETKETRDITMIRKLLLGSADLNTCWGKLFKLHTIKNNNLSFIKGLKTGEDAIFLLEYFERASTFLLVNESILYYRQHAESVMHKLDIHSKLDDFKKLYEHRIRMSEIWNDVELNKVMYREFFSVITDLLLKFSLKNKLSECNRVFSQVTEREMVKHILLHTSPTHLKPIYKKVELYLLRTNSLVLLSTYFKIKSVFM